MRSVTLEWIYPVSYTHLDVYKRQLLPLPVGIGFGGYKELRILKPVHIVLKLCCRKLEMESEMPVVLTDLNVLILRSHIEGCCWNRLHKIYKDADTSNKSQEPEDKVMCDFFRVVIDKTLFKQQM